MSALVRVNGIHKYFTRGSERIDVLKGGWRPQRRPRARLRSARGLRGQVLRRARNGLVLRRVSDLWRRPVRVRWYPDLGATHLRVRRRVCRGGGSRRPDVGSPSVQPETLVRAAPVRGGLLDRVRTAFRGRSRSGPNRRRHGRPPARPASGATGVRACPTSSISCNAGSGRPPAARVSGRSCRATLWRPTRWHLRAGQVELDDSVLRVEGDTHDCRGHGSFAVLDPLHSRRGWVCAQDRSPEPARAEIHADQ